MTGVEILAMEEVAISYAWNWEAYFITICIFVLLSGFVGLVTNGPHEMLKGLVAGISTGIILGAIFGMLPAGTTLPDEYETRYKVTISDEVFMNDFLERYEILDQEGKIYTVREVGVEYGE